MARKVIIDCDPGIDDAVALILALFDPRLDVVAITTCSGTVESDRCTQNVLGLLERLDPPRIPRVGAGTDPEDAPVSDNRFLHGTDGVGNLGFSPVQRQHQVSSEKLIVETIKSDPDDVTILCLGPLTGVARAFQRDPSIMELVDKVVVVGGSVDCIGDVTAAAEFNMHFDPSSASSVFRSHTTKTLIPLEITNQVTFDLNLLNQIPPKHSRAGEVLHPMLSHLFRSYRQHRAQETIALQAAIGIAYLVEPMLFQSEERGLEVEELGELTRGATIVDRRAFAAHQRGVEIVSAVDAEAVKDCVINGLRFAGQETGGA
ncbi:MAG: nucleoside hydrolase [Pirellula sp.]|jgi:inosine-uridine nucleoside N-ribohydrolase|nr:nucleoside hydrolase [Pirellula sp.]